MKAKDRLIDFLRTAPNSETHIYSFEIAGTLADANQHVHRMRVELSRLRASLKERGKQIKPFKMLIHNIEFVEARYTSIIELQYTVSVSPKIIKAINEVFDAIAVDGGRLNEKELRNLPPQPVKKFIGGFDVKIK